MSRGTERYLADHGPAAAAAWSWPSSPRLSLLGSGAASAAASALVTIVIVFGCVIGLAVLGGLGWLVYRARSGTARSDRPGGPIAARPVYQLTPDPRPRLEETHKRPIEPPCEVHLHLNVTPDQLAAIVRHYTGEK